MTQRCCAPSLGIRAVTFFSNIVVSNVALVRALPRAARVGLFLFFVAGLADGALMPFFALWAQNEAGVATGFIGLLLGCYAGGELLATPFVGGIADRLGRRPVLLVSTAGVGLGFLLLYTTRGAFMAAAALILIGVFESVLHPTAATVIADVVPADRLRAHFALTRVVSNAGRVVGPALGAALVLWSLGVVFVGSAAALLIGALAVLLFLPETRSAEAPAENDDEAGLTALTAVFRDRRLAALLMPVAAIEIASSWIEAVMPLYATGAGTLTPSGVGLLFTYAGALNVLFALPVTHGSARVPGFAVVAASAVALALAFAALLASPGLALLIAAVTLLAFAGMLFGPLTQTVVTELAPRNARATYMAAFAVVGDLKDAAGPAIGTWLYAMAMVLPWLVGLPVALAAGLALAFAARRHEAAHQGE
jgi:MFS transporter, DHA1 family, tetracycline resistance protein